ncbi:hypothetical protein WBQ88_20080 [Sphingopyxis sp. CCNWLW253]|uniref:hypothetical protein n=1 Tax=unclassified Sphingopyxis TaxID=2614943 RepID=UPI00301308D6
MRIIEFRLLPGLAAASVIAMPLPAIAAGGAHGVDDAAVETPGACHLESWVSDLGHGERLVNFSPACTAEALPAVEIGGTVQRVGTPGARRWLAGPAIKWTLHEGGRGPAVGLAGSALIDPGSGHIDSAALLVPVTFRPAGNLTVNLNAGVGHSRGEGAHPLYGAQVDVAAAKGVALMAEIFGRPDQRPALQAGIRWTFDRDRIDLDLLAGRQGGAAGDGSITLGLTIRR